MPESDNPALNFHDFHEMMLRNYFELENNSNPLPSERNEADEASSGGQAARGTQNQKLHYNSESRSAVET